MPVQTFQEDGLMFTGLVEGIGKIVGISRVGGDVRLTVRPGFPMDDCRIGDSVSVNGACLTVTDIAARVLGMDVSTETLRCTTLGRLKTGDPVNLERALRLGERLGGHLVAGHVDGIGTIRVKDRRERSWLLRVAVDALLTAYMIDKGSVAVDGVSLTINRTGPDFFECNIIPQTGRETVLLERRIGDLVNIETDLIGKYVEKFFLRGKTAPGREPRDEKRPGITLEMLYQNGFGD